MAGTESQPARVPSQWAPHAPAGSLLVPNGNFEQGSTVWTEFSQLGWDLIVNSGFPTGVAPRSGSWATWLAGDFDEISWIEQQITLPSNASMLSYYHWIDSEDLCGTPVNQVYDIAKISINGNIIDEYDLCEDANTGNWELHEVAISSYAGQTVMVRIRADADDSFNSNLFIDDVSIETAEVIFLDNFESGNTSAWSFQTP